MKTLLPALCALGLAATGCSGLGSGPDAGGPVDAGTPDANLALPLNQVNATISIVHSADDSTAAVTANLVTSTGTKVVLKGNQALQVGPHGGSTPITLAGPDGAGAYTASLPTNPSYDLVVREPTRGVATTTVAAPEQFSVTSPAAGGDASLRGFTLTWSGGNGPDGGTSPASVTLTLSQAGVNPPFSKDLPGDPGSYTFVATDLQNFSQGTPLNASVTKRTQRTAVQGFAAGTAEVERSASQALNPRP